MEGTLPSASVSGAGRSDPALSHYTELEQGLSRTSLAFHGGLAASLEHLHSDGLGCILGPIRLWSEENLACGTAIEKCLEGLGCLPASITGSDRCWLQAIALGTESLQS